MLKCKTFVKISIVWLFSLVLLFPSNNFEKITYAQAPETVFKIEEGELKWKLYLYNRSLEEGLNYKQFRQLRKLAECESGWRQFNSKGEVLSGYVHPFDKGIFQINSKVWEESARSIGHDIHNPYGNIDMALWIYKGFGIKQWVCKV